MCNLLEGGKELILRQLKKWPQQEESSGRVKPCSAREFARTFDRFVRKCIKFQETSCIAILIKLAVCRRYFLLTCQQAHLDITGYVIIHRIAEYGQQKIHSKLNMYHFILHKLLCGAGLRHNSSQVHIFSIRRVIQILLPLPISAMTVFCATTSFQLINIVVMWIGSFLCKLAFLRTLQTQ